MRSIVKWYIPVGALALLALSCNNSAGAKKNSGGKAANACNCSQYNPQNSSNQSGYSGNNNGFNNSSAQSQGYSEPYNTSNNGYDSSDSSTVIFLADLAGKPTWEGTIQGIVNLKCLSCHGSSSPSGGVDLSTYSAASAHSDRIVQTIQLPTTDREYMPPTASPQLTTTEKQSFLDWKNNNYEQGTSSQGTDPNAYQNGPANNYNNNNSTFPQNNQYYNGGTNSADANSCSQICAGQSANSTGGTTQNYNNGNNGQNYNQGQPNNFQQGGTSQGNTWGTP